MEEEIKQVLEGGSNEITLEETIEAENSPLNHPVSEEDIGHGKTIQDKEIENDQKSGKETTNDNVQDQQFHVNDGVPEQEINENYSEQPSNENPGESFELPEGHAKQAADTFLGITDNLLEVIGGTFVKVRKHKDFYEFEEIVQVIDEHNTKNVKRVKLDEEDKILLRPLLITILKKRAQKLTPEQQLMGAVLSILIKKVKMAMEIRAENEILVDRIRGIIREEKGENTEKGNKTEPEKQVEQEDYEVVEPDQIIQEQVLEVAEDDKNEQTNDTQNKE